MARLEALEKNDFAAIRGLLNANYGNMFERAYIQPVSLGNQSFTYRIQNNGAEFFLKLAEPSDTVRMGLPEQFAQYLYTQGLPAVHFEKMKDGRITKALPTDAASLKQLIPDLPEDPALIKRLSGAVISLSPAVRGTPLPSRAEDMDPFNRSLPQLAGDVGELAGRIAANTQGFLASHHLTLEDIPSSGYNHFEKTGEQLLKVLHLDAFGKFGDVHHQLHVNNSPASEHLHHHASIMRANAALMEKLAPRHAQPDAMHANALLLKQFADRYENGLALELMHYTNQMIEMKPRLLKRETTLSHGDFWRDNLLTENGKLTGVIDFDRLQRGDKLHDLIHYFGQTDFNPMLIQRALKGFEKGNGAALTPEDISLIPYLKLQNEMTGVPLDLEYAFAKGFPKDTMTRPLSEAEILGSQIEEMKPKVMFGRFDALKPFIHADYNQILNQPQFNTSLFCTSGRIHAEGGQSLFDYIGAVFGPHDLQPENESRLAEKIDTVIDNEVRLRLFAANHPDRKEYTIDEVVQLYPNVTITDEQRDARRAELKREITGRLEAMPKTFHPHAQMMERQLGELPPLIQEWLYLKGTEFIFTANTTIDSNGRTVYKGNEDMFPHHPAVAHMRKGGGNFLTYRPQDKNGITYAYTSMQRDPRVLLAHEAIGHALYNEARQRDPESAKNVVAAATAAAQADLGDIDKTKFSNPNPDNGRLGALVRAVQNSKDDAALWNMLQQIDGARLPKLTGEARTKWLADVRALATNSFEKMGPQGWMYNVKMYAERNLFMDELIAATAEQMYVRGRGKESAMNFVLPNLTNFFNTTLMDEMRRFVEEKRVSNASEAEAAITEDRLRMQTMRRELIEESQRYRNFGNMALGAAVLSATAAGVALLSGGWIAAAGFAALSGAGFFSSTRWEDNVKEVMHKIAALPAAGRRAHRRVQEMAHELIHGDKWQQKVSQLQQDYNERAV